MKDYIKRFLKKSDFFIFLLTKVRKTFRSLNSQSNESEILEKLLKWHPSIPKNFIEFGFGAWEFNCIKLAQEEHWEGLLIDGNNYQVRMSNFIFHNKIKAIKYWLTLENLNPIVDFAKNKKIGILSVDIDGNDFWFLRKLVKLKPALIIAEYNSSFGLKMISVPYDPNFDRTKNSSSNLYYGASITAISFLLEKNNYSLIEISSLGNNLFFLRNDLLNPSDIPLSAANCFREQFISKHTRHLDHFEIMKDQDFIEINEENLMDT